MSDCGHCTTPCDTRKPISKASVTIALAGNPNCGKTTLFNALTGSKQRVGNWPGVTVERKSGHYRLDKETIEVIDLPGVYSLSQSAVGTAIDERIACDFILARKASIVINIVDASNLERHLYLTTQLMEMKVPFILALNMMDVAAARHINIDVKALAKQLGCKVVPLTANKVQGIHELKQAILSYQTPQVPRTITYPPAIQTAIKEVAALNNDHPCAEWIAMRLLEDDLYANAHATPAQKDTIASKQVEIRETLDEDADILLADARYQFIQTLLTNCVSKGKQKYHTWTTWIDNIVLNRVLGVPIFLSVMYALFFFSINIGGALQDFFDISSQTLCVDGFAYVLTQIGAPAWLTALLANGVGKGINTTITFIPVIGAMFLFLAFLEDSGYMSRAAFVIDRFMQALGLPGKAFVPMIVGFGCNVPAVMAARTLENKRDRILTIMMSPFMSCGARLAIYAIFTAAFFPHGGQNVVFALYLIGILMAALTGFILRQTVLKGDPAPLVMELPAYHVPHFRTLSLHAWQRLKGFVFRAGKLIVPICILIGALNALNVDGSMNAGDGSTHSLLSLLGQYVTPIFAPLGIHADNWPATVGLVTGILAKEVVVGTLNTLYTQMGHLTAANGSGFHLWLNLQAALQSIPDNFSHLYTAIFNPVLAEAPIDTLNQGVYGLMAERFDGKVGAFAYLLFVLLYFPCVSTTAAMLRELPRGWSIFSALWMTGIAYGTAVFFYQAATFSHHPVSSAIWLSAILIAFFATIFIIRYQANDEINTAKPLLPVGEPV